MSSFEEAVGIDGGSCFDDAIFIDDKKETISKPQISAVPTEVGYLAAKGFMSADEALTSGKTTNEAIQMWQEDLKQS